MNSTARYKVRRVLEHEGTLAQLEVQLSRSVAGCREYVRGQLVREIERSQPELMREATQDELEFQCRTLLCQLNSEHLTNIWTDWFKTNKDSAT